MTEAQTPPTPPLTEVQCVALNAELTDWEQDGFVATAANNVTKVWAGRAKRCAAIFKNLLATIQSERALRERAEAALREIEGGCFDGASTMVLSGDWRGAYNALQSIARAALAPVKP